MSGSQVSGASSWCLHHAGDVVPTGAASARWHLCWPPQLGLTAAALCVCLIAAETLPRDGGPAEAPGGEEQADEQEE